MNNDMDVLIVDDSEIIREKLHEMMIEVEVVKHVFHAQDFDSAMIQVKKNKPSVVLLDVSLPGRNGIEILKEIKTFNKSIHVIMVSNVSTEYHRKVCGFLGADFFIDKHHDFENIPSLLNTLDSKKSN